MQLINLKKLLAMQVFLLTLFYSETSGKIIYVDIDATGTNDGTSWANAYIYLQDALADARTQEKPLEIRVAEGTYKPDHGASIVVGDRKAVFQMIDSVTLRGSYAGTSAPDPNARDIKKYQTVLSGDLSGNDVPRCLTFEIIEQKWQQYTDNSECVIDGSSTDRMTVLEGFVITGGYHVPSVVPGRGGGSLPPSSGGGMRNISGSPTVINCTFEGNSGAVLNLTDSSPAFVNCRFVRNLVGEGGAIVSGESNPEILGCVFEGNSAWGDGGAISNRDGRVLVSECRFVSNQVSDKGGAIFSIKSSLTLVGCTFTDNSAGIGGAIFNDEGTTSTLARCIFADNSSEVSGGAITDLSNEFVLTNCTFNCNSSNIGGAMDVWGPTSLTNCTFMGNSAKRGYGGAIFSSGANLTNCIFIGNRALGYRHSNGSWFPSIGGAICNIGVKRMTICTNCTFSNNLAQFGCAIFHLDSLGLRVHNCILWSSVNQIYFQGWPDPNVCFSTVQGGWPGVGNIDTDPCFAEPGYWDPNGTPEDTNDDLWVDGDYHLKSQTGRWEPVSQSWIKDNVTSPCIDAGDPMSPIGTEPFPNGGRINMGTYGGTADASKSYFGELICETIVAGDINGDCKVDFLDFILLVSHWLEDRTDISDL